MSRDNNEDCRPYPDSEGAVSWYDAFDMGLNRIYDVVAHVLCDPLSVIYSRVTKSLASLSDDRRMKHMAFWKKQFGTYEE
jgi:hypothetical protein